MITMTIQGTNATTRPATTSNAAPRTKQDLEAATREFRDAIRSNIARELNAARLKQAQSQGGGVSVQGEPVVAPTPPAPPEPPGTFTIRGPGGTQTFTIPPNSFDNTIPPQAVTISVAFFLMIAVLIIGLPIARAIARRMDRKAAPAQIPGEISSQLAHLSQSVDAIALEVERISEGQRFTTRLLSEQKQSLPAGTGR